MSQVAVFDCPMGIAGDMTVGALIDAGVPFSYLEREIKKLKLKGYALSVRNVKSGAFRTKKFSVKIKKHPSHHHTSLREIEKNIKSSKLPLGVKKRAITIFKNLGRAEAKVHGKPLQKVHFHEVGAIDSIIDIVGTALCFEYLNIKRAYVRNITIGRGIQKGSHGAMPVPVPATYKLLQGFTLNQSRHGREMITPTGASVLASLCEKGSNIPALKFKSIGYGAGDRKLNGKRGFVRVGLAETV